MNDTKTHTPFDSNDNLISSSQSENISNGARRFGLSRFANKAVLVILDKSRFETRMFNYRTRNEINSMHFLCVEKPQM